MTASPAHLTNKSKSQDFPGGNTMSASPRSTRGRCDSGSRWPRALPAPPATIRPGALALTSSHLLPRNWGATFGCGRLPLVCWSARFPPGGFARVVLLSVPGSGTPISSAKRRTSAPAAADSTSLAGLCAARPRNRTRSSSAGSSSSSWLAPAAARLPPVHGVCSAAASRQNRRTWSQPSHEGCRQCARSLSLSSTRGSAALGQAGA
mmetsp:Transcript_103181/g.287188  ORF Transcript_103181/g.287188 Transcript_103181/m.287188 type:complete len:207 (-) Transcript_103181:9-629(-)